LTYQKMTEDAEDKWTDMRVRTLLSAWCGVVDFSHFLLK
jgi:hypothetical protein